MADADAPDNVSGTLNLTLQATAQEASGQIAKAIAPFTVTIDAVNDAPDLALTASKHAEEGASQAHAIDLAQAGDIDSSHLVGATITLSSGQPSDRLDFDGFTLHDDGGRVMIGNTGIEVIGGGHAAGSGVLTLSGSALPETYATVLQSLVLESEDPSGLTAGTRSIGVVLRDSAGASSMQKSVDVVVEDVTPAHAAGQGLDVSDSSVVSEVTAADILLLMGDDGIGTGNDSTAAWTEQIDSSGARETAPHHAVDLDQPGTDHVLIFDDLQSDAMRVSWS
ncbi:hypothetical protein ACFQY9_12520 [Microvirga aerilata]|uniref:hypothetical protein n=1 Tax=Microvirga aerilata TaxID=670292 RepID=UPI00362B13E5